MNQIKRSVYDDYPEDTDLPVLTRKLPEVIEPVVIEVKLTLWMKLKRWFKWLF